MQDTPFELAKADFRRHFLPLLNSSPSSKQPVLSPLSPLSPSSRYPNLKYVKTPVRSSKPYSTNTPQSRNTASLGGPLYFTEKELPSPLPCTQTTLGDLTTMPSLFSSTMASTLSVTHSPKKVLKKIQSTSNVGSPKKMLRRGSSIDTVSYKSARLTTKAIIREIQGKTEVIEGTKLQDPRRISKAVSDCDCQSKQLRKYVERIGEGILSEKDLLGENSTFASSLTNLSEAADDPPPREQEGKKSEYKTPLIDLTKVQTPQRDSSEIIDEQGSVFDFEQRSGKGFVSSRTMLIQTPIKPFAQKILNHQEDENDFQDLVRLVKELIEERKKLKLKVSLDSDMKFLQQWNKYDSPIEFLTQFAPQSGFRNPSRRTVKHAPSSIASLFNIKQEGEESERKKSSTSLKREESDLTLDYFQTNGGLNSKRKEKEQDQRKTQSRSDYSKCWFISRSEWKKRAQSKPTSSGKKKVGGSVDKRNFITNPTHSLSGMVRDIMKLPREGSHPSEGDQRDVQKIEQLYNLVELCENLSLREENEYYSVISEWSKMQRNQSEHKINSLAKGIKGISDLSRKNSCPLEASIQKTKEEQEKTTLDVINILADIARNSRTKQRLIKEKFERTDLLLAEGREREMARVLEASESMKQRNYKRNSQRLQSFLYECKKKRLLEIK